MTLSRKLRLASLIFLLVCTVGCDQTSKHFARAQLSKSDSVAVSGGLIELRLAENPGSFLSLGAQLPNPARFIVFTLGAGVGLIALASYLVSRAPDWWRFIGVSFVLAGGMVGRIYRSRAITTKCERQGSNTTCNASSPPRLRILNSPSVNYNGDGRSHIGSGTSFLNQKFS